MSKKKVLIDLEIVCDPPRHTRYYWYAIEQQEKEMEKWVNDFHEFIRDHRSQDPVNLKIQRVYQDQCEYCHREWEGDEGCPVCCDEAVKEWEEAIAKTVVKIESAK